MANPIPETEKPRLLREVLLNHDLNPNDVLDLAAGLETFLLAQIAIERQMQRQWDEERELAAEAELDGAEASDD